MKERGYWVAWFVCASFLLVLTAGFTCAAAAETVRVTAEPVVLIEKAYLDQLDRNRHRAVEVEAVKLATASEHSTLLLVFIGAAMLTVVGGLLFRSRAFNNRRLGFKLASGFAAVILLALALGGSSIYYLENINTKYDLALAAADLDMMAGEAAALQNAFVLYGIEDQAKGEQIREEVEALLAEFAADVARMEQQELETDELAVLGHIKEAVQKYKKTFAHLVDKYHAIEALKEELESLSESVGHELASVIHVHEKELEELERTAAGGDQLMLQTKLVETLFEAEVLAWKLAHAEVAFLLDKHIERVVTMETELSKIYAYLATGKKLINRLDAPAAQKRADIALLEKVTAELHEYQKKLAEVVVDELLVSSDLIDLSADIKEIEANGAAFAERMDHEAEATKTDAEAASFGLLALALLIGSVVSFVLTRSIVRPVGEAMEMIEELEKGHLDSRVTARSQDEIGQMVDTMNRFADSLQDEVVGNLQKLADGDLNFEVVPRDAEDGVRGALQKLGSDLNGIVSQIQVAGEQIASGSSQVSDSSQSLSQGATEQASSLEEISASLNQMSAQTSTNAENANQANLLSNEAQSAAQNGSRQMQEMVSAMNDINESGQNISKIIKTIDEIAFQTNLLALNAAVEAARAGQHGKGFAVVAEEVRNLAARSARAAEETSVLIQGSVEKTENGSLIASQTADSLQEIVDGVTKVSNLVSEIAAASSEQAQGITQINQGVSQIDQVTQQNTANAEESAAAAEELSGQAEQLRQMLRRFRLKESGLNRGTAHLSPPDVAAVGWAHPEKTRAAIGSEGQSARVAIVLDDEEFGKY